MPIELDPFSAPISKRRPLLGVTILLIEDSRFCSEAVRLMTMRTGARLRRADCVRSAHKHLAMYRPDLVIVDVGLPDGSGVDLIAELHGQDFATLAISGSVNEETRSDVMAAGANGFFAKTYWKHSTISRSNHCVHQRQYNNARVRTKHCERATRAGSAGVGR